MFFNPYQDLKAVRNPDMFFGRTTLLRRLYSALVSQQCLSLVGPRHIGKSSVLAYMRFSAAQRQFDYDLSSYIFVPLDLRTYRQRTSEFFFETVSQQIADQCHNLNLLVGSRKGPDEFSSMLKQITDKGFYPVLLMDAFDNITGNEHFDLEFFSFLRAQTQTQGVSYVTASIAPLNDICRQDVKGSPFFNIFGLQTLEPLTLSEAQELVTTPAQRAGCPFTASEQDWILSLAGRHPFFIQRVCHFLFEEKCQGETPSFDLDLVEELVYSELKPHFTSLWGDLPAYQQKQLEDQARHREAPRKFRPELSESMLFHRFVREKYDIHISEKTAQMTVEDLEKILDKINDLPALGESDLKDWRVVSIRLKGHVAHSPIEIGRATREVLQEALERLKGSDTPSKDGADWMLYKILQYRYFRRNTKRNNEQIAANLSYSSVRTFYRDRKKAIEVLLAAVLDMEKALY